MVGALSVCTITNQTPTVTCQNIQFSATFDFASSNLPVKFTHEPYKHEMRNFFWRHNVCQYLASQKFAKGHVGCGISNKKDDFQTGASCDLTDGQDEDWSSLEQTEEVIASFLQSNTDVQKTSWLLENQENALNKLKAILLHVLSMEQWNAGRLKLCHGRYVVGATNLVHYLALKSVDVEKLKEELHSKYLLDLDKVNRHVIASLSSVIKMLDNSQSNSLIRNYSIGDGISMSKTPVKQIKGEYIMKTMRKKAFSKSDLLLGGLQDNRTTHIMVTVGEEATENETLVTDLINAGATVIRINCAHGNPSVWSDIIRRVKRSSQVLEKPCKILMDLAGPKLRTGRLKAGPCVVKISPEKDAFGNVICPAQIWLSTPETGSPPAHVSPDAVLPVDDQEFLNKLEVNDTVRFFDTHGKRRILKIIRKYHVFSGFGLVAECAKTAYVESGTKLFIKDKRRKSSFGFVVNVPPVQQFVRLRVGDLLTISRDCSNDQDGSTISAVGPHVITCSSGYLFDSVKVGEPIAFDDGKIWGVVKGTSISEIIVSVTHAGPKGTKLGSEKSINIPESYIRYEGLTSKDLIDLDFVATHSDMVGVSFVRDVSDIVLLRQELQKRKNLNLGVVLKIETRGGVEKLPDLLLEAMKCSNPLGVMIARGDLAVECGWEKLADIQEQILSLCEAAHIPVIWATQVLESLVKSGVPSRAEITDVACGRRASCVMLNKGKHIVEAVSTLKTILDNRFTKANAERKPLESSISSQ